MGLSDRALDAGQLLRVVLQDEDFGRRPHSSNAFSHQMSDSG
jgi:hypothetical protein